MRKWIHPKTITGDAVSGESYLKRPKINKLFWSYIEKKSNVLFVAPRRVGKTSIMKDLVSTSLKKYHCIYRDVEGATTKNQFYQRIFEMLIQRLEGVKKAKRLFNKWIKKYEIKSIGRNGIDIGRKLTAYQKEVNDILIDVSKAELTVILFIDEFVEVILNLKKKNKADEAISLLHELREIRHDERFRNIIFVFAGSIGLHYIVKDIGRPKLINDIEPLRIEELNKTEARRLINQLTNVATIKYNDKLRDYLMQKIEYLLPYFVQLMIQEIDLIAYKADSEDINNDIIDVAFKNVVKNTANFDDWLKRLKDYMGKSFPYINHILCYCAHKDILKIQEAYNIAIKFGEENQYKNLLDELVRDGYLVEENKSYRFLSPFIKAYWLHKNPIF